jgi:class 3 adenylate cyclase/response regulator of citrate/malate metabolism
MTHANDELFEFAAEAESPPVPTEASGEWRVLIVDDEPQVHTITKLVLDGLRVDERQVVFDDAYSGPEARAKLEANVYALVLLDVVMGSDDDGLQVAQWLRTVKHEHTTRIVLRTGQPGLAPEREVMLDYDINDYQPKAELSSQRLATSVIGAIRSYRDLHTIREQKQGLEKIVLATATLFDRRSTEQLVSGVLQQIAALLGQADSALFLQADGDDGELRVSAASGHFEAALGRNARDVLSPQRYLEIHKLLHRHQSGKSTSWSLHTMVHSQGSGAQPAGVYLEPARRIDPWQERLLDLFCANAAVAFDNQRLNGEQAELLRAFGRFVPQRMLDAIGIRDITRVAVGEQTQRDMTVMFVDVRSFTPLAERCGSRETFRILNTLFAAIVPIVHQYGGVVDKYLGDGLLSLFPDAGDGPLQAALEMLAAVDRISREESQRVGSELDIGIGIHRGPTILGLVGAQDRLESTVISDAVNVASRLERLTRVYGARVVVSASALMPSSPLRVHARCIGRQAVRGKSEAVECYELFAADPAPQQAAKAASRARFEAAAQLLTQERWSEARRGFEEILQQTPDDLAARELAEMARRGLLL